MSVFIDYRRGAQEQWNVYQGVLSITELIKLARNVQSEEENDTDRKGLVSESSTYKNNNYYCFFDEDGCT